MQFIYLALFLLVSFFAPPLKAQGTSWAKIAVSVPAGEEYGAFDLADFRDISVPTLNTAYIVGNSGTNLSLPGYILKTTNSGDDWSLSFTVNADSSYTGGAETLYGIDCADERRCFAVGSRGIVLRTLNGGTTWLPPLDGEPLSAPPLGTPTLWRVRVVHPTRNIIVAVGNNGHIWRSTNNGESWSYISGIAGLSSTARSAVTFNDIHCVPQTSESWSTRTCWIVGGDKIVKSENDGATWALQSTAALEIEAGPDLDNVFALDPLKVWISNFNIGKSINGGDSWEMGEQVDGAFLPVSGIACLEENNCWSISTFGGGDIRRARNGNIWRHFFAFADLEDIAADQREDFIDVLVLNADGSRVTILPNLHEIKFFNAALGFIVGNNRTLLRRTGVDLIPSDGWSLACANSSQYLHIIAQVKNNGGKPMDPSMVPFNVKFESLDAAGNVIGAQTYSVSEAIPPGENRTVPIPFPVGAETYALFNPDGLAELTFRMTVDVEGNGVVPEIVENNNSRTQTTTCGIAASEAGGGGSPPSPSPSPRSESEKDKKKKDGKKKKSKWKK